MQSVFHKIKIRGSYCSTKKEEISQRLQIGFIKVGLLLLYKDVICIYLRTSYAQALFKLLLPTIERAVTSYCY